MTSDTNLLGLSGLVYRQVGQLSKAHPERDRPRAEPARAHVAGSRTAKAPSPGPGPGLRGEGRGGPDRPLEEVQAGPWAGSPEVLPQMCGQGGRGQLKGAARWHLLESPH